MDFSFNQDQEILRKSAHEFLVEKFPRGLLKELINGNKVFPLELWKEMAGLGWLGLMIPEKYGGSGRSFLDLAVLLEEMGRACFLGPFFSTVILGTLPILEAGSEQQKTYYLSNTASGNMIFTLALTEGSATYKPLVIDTRAISNRDHYLINGSKIFVENANIADFILCAARTDNSLSPEEGITLFLVEGKARGIGCNQLKSIQGDMQCEVSFNNVSVPKLNMLGELGHGWSIIRNTLEKATVAKCAEMMGGAQQVLEMTVDYAKKRKQFARPIGSFQAVQHHCANMLIDVDGSKLITYEAAWKVSKGMPATMEVAMAKAWVSEAYQRVVTLGHQIHGAIGFCESHDLPLYFKRSRVEGMTFGDAEFHIWTVADKLGL